MNIAKKIFAVATSSLMVVASVASFATSAHAAVHATGTNVVSNGTVYFLDGTSKRPYTSAGAFLSYGFNSWSGVVAASAEDLALPTGAFVPPMDGSLINDNGTVYLVTNGQRAGFTSASNFLGLGFSFSNVIPGDTSFMTSAALINGTSMAHPAGTLVNQAGTVYLMTMTGKQGIPSLAVFNSWGYSFSKVVPANSYDAAVAMSAGIMPSFAAGCLSPLNCQGGTNPLPTGNVSASLATGSPAGESLIAGQSAAPIEMFNFTGSGTVTQVVLQKTGVSSNSTPANVYLYSGATRVTDAATVSGTNGQVTFSNPNGLFTVNGSTTITVAADIAASTSGQTVGFNLLSAATGTTAVAGAPVTGGVSGAIAVVSDLGTVTTTGTVTPTTGTLNPASATTVFQTSVSVSGHNVSFTRLALREVGSAQYNSFANFKLMVDGNQVSSASGLDVNGYVTFGLNTTMQTGSHTIAVVADIVGGASRTFSFQIQNQADIGLIDMQYGVGISLNGTGSYSPVTTGTMTIQAGSVVVQKDVASPSGNSTYNGSSVTLATFDVTAYGEPVKINQINVSATGTHTDGTTAIASGAGDYLKNGKVLIANSQYGSTTNLLIGGNTTFTLNYTINPGSTITVMIQADTADTLGTIGSGSVVTAGLVGITNNAQGQSSLNVSTVPASPITGNTVTLTSGTLALAVNSTYQNQTVVAPQTGYHLGSFTMTNSSQTDTDNVNTLSVYFNGTANFSAAYLNNVKVLVNNGQVGTTFPTVSTTTTGTESVTVSPSLSLAPGASATVDVYGDVSSSATSSGSHTMQVYLEASGNTGSGTAITAPASGTTVNSIIYAVGQTLTVGSGTLNVAVNFGTSPLAKIVNAPQTGLLVGSYKFTSTNSSYTINQVTLTFPGAGNPGSIITAVHLTDANGAAVGSAQPLNAGSVTFNGLSLVVPANSNGTNLNVSVDLANIGPSAGVSGSSITPELTGYQDLNSNGVQTPVTGLTLSTNNIYAYAATPTITAGNLPSSVLAAGTQTLAVFTVGATGGTIAWGKLTFAVSVNGAAETTASYALYDSTGTQIPGSFSTASTSAGVSIAAQAFTPTNPEEISSSKTYTLKATIGGTIATGDSISTSINHSAGVVFAAPTTFAAVNTAGTTFNWSDESAAGHTTGTSDWNNDNLVQQMPVGSFTLSK